MLYYIILHRQLFRYLAEPFGGQALPARALVDAVYGVIIIINCVAL